MNSFRLSYIYLFVFILFSSCNIEPYEGDVIDNPNASGGSEFKVDFDGETYVADSVTASLGGGILNITAFRGENQEAFILTLFADSPGNYPVGVSNNNVEVNGITYSTNTKTGAGEVWIGVTDFLTSQGEVVITSIDSVNKTISGTFLFTGHNVNQGSKEFTKGVFTNISYAEDSVPSNNENSFFAKVNGEEFVEEKINAIAVSTGGISSLGISATINNTQVISLNLNTDIAVGEHDLTTFGQPSGIYSKSFTESYSSDSGKVVITKHDKVNKRIAGTFYFIATSFLPTSSEQYEITEGVFDVTYF